MARANYPDYFRNHACSILGKSLFDIQRALQKGHFRLVAEKGRSLDSQGPLVARLKNKHPNNWNCLT